MQYPEEPAKTLTDPHELLLGYVEAYRNAARRKVAELPESELRPAGCRRDGRRSH
jgi:hypothetical protein